MLHRREALRKYVQYVRYIQFDHWYMAVGSHRSAGDQGALLHEVLSRWKSRLMARTYGLGDYWCLNIVKRFGARG